VLVEHWRAATGDDDRPRHHDHRPRLDTTVLAVPTAAALQPIVDQWRQQTESPGTIVAVRVGTGPASIVVSGSDAKSGAPLDAHVPYAIASITKTFVGALVLQLVDEGKLALDDPLSKYVATFPNADRITLRELLTHTSGIPPEGDDAGPSIYSDAWEELLLANLAKTFTADEILDFVHDRPLMFEPGTGVQYSNINMILLGKVVEAVTGTDLTTAFHQRLLGAARTHAHLFRRDRGWTRGDIGGVHAYRWRPSGEHRGLPVERPPFRARCCRRHDLDRRRHAHVE